MALDIALHAKISIKQFIQNFAFLIILGKKNLNQNFQSVKRNFLRNKKIFNNMKTKLRCLNLMKETVQSKYCLCVH